MYRSTSGTAAARARDVCGREATGLSLVGAGVLGFSMSTSIGYERETMSIELDQPNGKYLGRRLNETEQNFTFTRVRSIVELNQPTNDSFSQSFACRCQTTQDTKNETRLFGIDRFFNTSNLFFDI